MFRKRLTTSSRRCPKSKNQRARRRKLIEERLEPRILLAANGGDTRHLRLAVSATEEYTEFFGSRAAAKAEIEKTISGVNKVFNRELNLHLDLLDVDAIIYGPGNSPDPFTFSPGAATFPQNQALLDSVLTPAGYDLGIVFGAFPDGVAHLAGAGIDAHKAKAYTGFSPEEGGPAGGSAIDNVLHEMGHHLAASHTWNGTLGPPSSSCGDAGQHSPSTAFEPGSGSTLVGYAGLCNEGLPPAPRDDLQQNSNFYYHAGSLDQIIAHLETLDGLGVGTKDVGVNSVPTVSAGTDFTIPAGTPFHIAVTGSDADDPTGESLRYTVEQMDTGPQQTLDPFPGDNGSSPLFRSFRPAPGQDGEFTRVFPQPSDILSGTTTIGEYLPSTDRELNFRATVRDGEGGTNGDDVKLTVVDTGSPFAITSHGAGTELDGSTSSTVTWDAAGTTGSGIDTPLVNILLSTDGGKTFPHLLANTANDGSHAITVPNFGTTEARIKVEGDGNVFFDISDADFTINADSAVAGVTVTNDVFVGEGGTFSPLTDTYTLALNTVPSSSVTISVDAGPGIEVSTDGSSFAPSVDFSRSNTSLQTITVRAVEDGKLDGGQQIPINHSITSSSDAAYPADLVIEQVVVGVADNETAPPIAVDIQAAGLPVPRNWNEINPTRFEVEETFFDLLREDGMPSGVSLTLDPEDVPSSLNTDLLINPLTAPSHAPSLVDVGGAAHYFDFFDSPFNVDAIWKGLDPGAKYNVYVFAMELFGSNGSLEPVIINQTVTISGDGINDPVPFLQNSEMRNRQLLVNDEEGDDTLPLESFAKTATASPSGEITVSIVRDDGVDLNRIVISGLAIQAVSDDVISSPPGFSKGFSPSTIDVGGTSRLTLTIDNSANSEAATSLDFTDTLPAGVTLASPSSATTTCTGGTLTALAGTSVISYTGGTVGAAASCTVSADVTSSMAGSHVNTSGDLTSSFGNSGTASGTLTVNEVTQLLDFGDAPTSQQSGFAGSYPTELPTGARHTPTALVLGSTVDSEADGQPTAAADGDGADEDGVLFVTSAIATTATANTASVLVTASEAGKLDAWIDFTRDGDWDDAGEKLFAGSIDLDAGPNLVSYTIPAGASTGDTYARFRLSSAGVSDPSGPADDGEVEDYRMTILDGDSPVPAVIDLVVGSVDVKADAADVVAEHDGQEIFRVPGSALSSHAFLGTGSDDELRLGDLTSALSSPIPLIFDGADGSDTVILTGSDQVLDLTNTSLNSLANIEVIDIIGASPNSLTLDATSVTNVTDSSDTLVVIHDEDDTVDYSGTGWDVKDPIFVAGGQRHVLVNGGARVETINTRPFQNPLVRFDVNKSEKPTDRDALLIINFIGRFEKPVIDLPPPTSAAELAENYFDVNGSQTATALDALNLINFLGVIANKENELAGAVASPQPAQPIAPPDAREQLKSTLPTFDYPSPEIIHDAVLKAISFLPPEAVTYLADLPRSLEVKIPTFIEDRLQTWQLALDELLDDELDWE